MRYNLLTILCSLRLYIVLGMSAIIRTYAIPEQKWNKPHASSAQSVEDFSAPSHRFVERGDRKAHRIKSCSCLSELISLSEKDDLQQASVLWKSKHKYPEESQVRRGAESILTRIKKQGRKRAYLKELLGRGRKSSLCMKSLHQELYVEFDSLRKLDVKCNWSVLRKLHLQYTWWRTLTCSKKAD